MKSIKQTILWSLLLLLLAIGTAQAEDIWGAVNNPNPEDKLFLRPTASTAGDPLGLYYNGTPIKLLEETNDSWIYVQVGALKGYMARAYVSFGSAAQAVAAQNPIVYVKAADPTARAQLRALPQDNARILDTLPNGAGFVVWGVGPEWIHGSAEGVEGFMRVSELSSVDQAVRDSYQLGYREGRQEARATQVFPQDAKLLSVRELLIPPSSIPYELHLYGWEDARGCWVDHGYLLQNDDILQVIPLTQADQTLLELIFLEDVNFDGFMDFRICRSMGAHNHYYDYWTWDPVKVRFYYNEAFSRIEAYPIFDPSANRIHCFAKDSAVRFYEFYYGVEGGLPILSQMEELYYERENKRIRTVYHPENGTLTPAQTWVERME